MQTEDGSAAAAAPRMAGHTPGPWERRVNEGNSVIRIEPAFNRDRSMAGKEVIGYATRYTLKQIAAGEIEPDDGRNFANAALIAAAPKMLKALEGVGQLRASIRTWALSNRIPGWQTEDDLFAAIEDAISSAKGA